MQKLLPDGILPIAPTNVSLNQPFLFTYTETSDDSRKQSSKASGFTILPDKFWHSLVLQLYYYCS